jgi:hypothetical protein
LVKKRKNPPSGSFYLKQYYVKINLLYEGISLLRNEDTLTERTLGGGLARFLFRMKIPSLKKFA